MVGALFAVLTVFVVGQLRVFVLLFHVATKDLRSSGVAATDRPGRWPSVAVQLPVYRESDVLERLVTAVVALDYPRTRLSVQVLDDSDGQTRADAAAVVAVGATHGTRVDYVHRDQRTGYKSGALNHGLALTDAELVAVFDADFLPDPDFLTRTVPLFGASDVGAVHTRWRHANGGASALTLMQSAVLDALFCFANGLRQVMDEPTMYLGTCGVWRTETIEAVGGWREAPFTDDGIDLSFRAQEAGWRVVYVNDALATADLPETYLAYRSQQRRWARAAFRLFLDHWRSAVRPPERWGPRLLELSSLHLVSSPPAILAVGLLSGLQVTFALPRSTAWVLTQVVGTASLALFPPVQEGLLAVRQLYDDWPRRWRRTLPALPLAIGMSVSILAGFADTLRDDRHEFVRTPKGGAGGVVRGSHTRWFTSASRLAVGETVAAGVLFAAGAAAVARGYAESVVLLLGLGACMATAGARSWREIRDGGRRVADG